MNDQLRGVAVINEWRRKAFALSGADVSMGSILSKSLDFMNTVVKNGLRAPNMNFALDALKHERDLAMEFDEKKSDALRDVVYGVVESIGAMVTELVEQNQQIAYTFNEYPAHQEPFAAVIADGKLENHDTTKKSHLVANFDADIMILPKEEPVDETAPLLQDHIEEPIGRRENLELNVKQEDNPISPAGIEESMALNDAGIASVQLEQQEPRPPISLTFIESNQGDAGIASPQLEQKSDEQSLQPATASQPTISLASSYSAKVDEEPENANDVDKNTNANADKATRPLRSCKGMNSRKKAIGKGHTTKEVKRRSIVKNDSTMKFCCPVCSKRLGSRSALGRHKESHNGRILTCLICPYSCARKDHLRQHCTTKHGIATFACSTCNARFDKLKQLQFHWRESGHVNAREMVLNIPLVP